MPVYAALSGHNCIYLPAVYRFYAAEGLYFVEEEYIDGISAAELLQGGEHCSKTRTLEITKAVLGAAEELHRKGFIHRDIKPEHILLTADGRIVLVDLGASTQIRPEKSGDTQLLGTAGYAAPEQFGFSRSDARTDIYAVGILLNELLTGVHPSVKLYRAGNLGQIIDQSFHVYIDEGAGQVTWSDELGGWDVVTTGCRPGTKGYLHAEKGGKHYAIKVITFAEPMSVYNCLPDINDLGKGWLKARRERPTAFEEGWLTVDYKKGEEVVLYLVAAHFFTLDGIDCDNPDVTIEELKTPIGNYPFPVAKLTYRSSKGGDAEFTVTSELNNYHIQMNEI